MQGEEQVPVQAASEVASKGHFMKRVFRVSQ